MRRRILAVLVVSVLALVAATVLAILAPARRIARHEAELAAELKAEAVLSAPPPLRYVVPWRQLASHLDGVAPLDSSEYEAFWGQVAIPLLAGNAPDLKAPALSALYERRARAMIGVKDALHYGFGPPPVETLLAPGPHVRDRLDAAEACLVLDEDEVRVGYLGELRRDLTKGSPLNGLYLELSGPGNLEAPLVALTLPHLATHDLDKVMVEAAYEDAGWPSFATAVRRHRLAFGCVLRRIQRGEIPTDLDPFRRTVEVARSWEDLPTFLREVEETTRSLPSHRAWAALKGRARVVPSSGLGPSLLAPPVETYDRWLRDVARLRCACVLVAVERFRRKNARWPTSTAEASPPPEMNVDPFTGEPLRLVERDGGLVVYSLGPNVFDDGGAVLATGSSRLSATGEPTDVGLILR